MATKNTRTSITANASEDRLKSKLKENYKKFLNEAPGEEDLDLDGGDDLDLDLDGEEGMDDMGIEGAEGEGMEGMDDMGDEGMGDDLGGIEGEEGLDPIDNLTDTEAEQVDHWIDELLGDSLENIEVDGGDSIDTETMAGDLDPMGEDQFIHDDLPMTSDDVNSIIDSDDSLAALEQELADMAIQQTGEGEEGGFEGFGETDETEENDLMNIGESKELKETEDPMDGIDKYFDQGYEGEDIKDDLQEDVELAKDNKDMGMKKVESGLNDKITSKVAATPGARTEEEIKNDVYKVVQESAKKSKMLVKAASVIAKAQKDLSKQTKLIESLKLENYRLIKANGLLSVAGDVLSKEARTQISESFDKCQSVDQVNKFYNKLTEKIKSANRPSLNNTVAGKKTKISVIKENAERNNEAISHKQERINMLMGLDTKNDVYFN